MSFGGQNKALVLLITETAAQLLLWQRPRLELLSRHGASPDDQDLFVEQIRLFPKHPVIIVSDLIDENFRHDSIVHVSGADRDALLKRKLDFAFRNTRYRIGIVIARQADGRKDDRILLSAISKPERIDVWAKLLLQEKMAVQAVTSVAHLLNVWLPLEKLEKEENLLVSKLDADNNLRQTFVKNGRVMFSRLASLTTVPERRLGVEILQESTQLRQYLERIQFLSYESQLRIHVMSSHSRDSIELDSYASDLNRFDTADIREKCAGLQIDVQDNPLLPSHYVIASILQRKRIDNLYAPPSLTRFDDLRSFGKLLLASAAAVLVLGLGLNLPGLMTVFDKREQADTMRTRTAPLRAEYEAHTSRFPETPVPPREMELVVDTFRLIDRQVLSPIAALNHIAAALETSPGLQLTSIGWQLMEADFDTTPDQYGNIPEPPPALTGLPADDQLTGAILQERTQIHVVIDGEAYSPQSFREAQDQVIRFIDALDQVDGVTIASRQMPIDIRTDVSVSAVINDSEVRAPFKLELDIEVPKAEAEEPEVAESEQLAGAAP
jgi:hypothetical protein